MTWLSGLSDEALVRQRYLLQHQLGDVPAALKTTPELLELSPNDIKLKEQLADLMVETGDLDSAWKLALELLRRDNQNGGYRAWYNRIRRLQEQ